MRGGAFLATSDATLGAANAPVTLDGGALVNNDSTPTFAAGRTITLGTSGGFLGSGWSKTTTVASQLTGPGQAARPRLRARSTAASRS